jgi:hypothetical protein
MGGYRQQLFLQTSGINLYKELIKMLSGTEPEFSPTKQLFQIRIELLPETKGVFELVTNLSDLKSLKSFKEIVTRKEPGEIVGPATLGFTWVSSINLESNNPKELNEDFMFIMKNVKIKVS